jgi:hypothetical protein
VCRVEAGGHFVQRIDDHHRRPHRVGALERALKCIGEHDRAEALALLIFATASRPIRVQLTSGYRGTCFRAASGTSPCEIAIAQSV